MATIGPTARRAGVVGGRVVVVARVVLGAGGVVGATEVA
jgi:hypothetical protein